MIDASPTAAVRADGPAPRAGAPLGLPGSLRSAPVLIAIVAAAAAVAAVQDSVAHALLRALLVLALVPCALIDIDRRIIPNRITGPAALTAIALGLALDPAGEPRRLMWAAICGGFLLVAAIVYPAGMGMGDVKLVAVMGLLLGPAVFVALMLALLANVLAGLGLIVRHGLRRARKTTMPFGPFLAGGGIVAAVAAAPLLSAYLGLAH